MTEATHLYRGMSTVMNEKVNIRSGNGIVSNNVHSLDLRGLSEMGKCFKLRGYVSRDIELDVHFNICCPNPNSEVFCDLRWDRYEIDKVGVLASLKS